MTLGGVLSIFSQRKRNNSSAGCHRDTVEMRLHAKLSVLT